MVSGTEQALCLFGSSLVILPNMHPKLNRQSMLLGTAVVVVLLLAFVALLVGIDRRSPLSPIEARLIGEWSHDPAETVRSFRADRSFSTSNGQFVGTWDVRDGRLTVTYWQPFELPTDFSAAALTHSIRRTRRETLSWRIEFSADNQQLSLDQGCVLQDGRLIPIRAGNEKWLFTRVRNAAK
ncbi:MAG TPA: hypothetical protein VFV87_19445 [Pirellulaceae bacterium]|nr:hypothetical protein [Pirellulaceae bacterium]